MKSWSQLGCLVLVANMGFAAELGEGAWRKAILEDRKAGVAEALFEMASKKARETMAETSKKAVEGWLDQALETLPETEREKLGAEILSQLRSEQGNLDQVLRLGLAGKNDEAQEAFAGVVLRALDTGTRSWDQRSGSKGKVRGVLEKLLGGSGALAEASQLVGKLAAGDYSGVGKDLARKIPWVEAVHSTTLQAIEVQRQALSSLSDSYFDDLYLRWKTPEGGPGTLEDLRIQSTRGQGFFRWLHPTSETQPRDVSDLKVQRQFEKRFEAEAKARTKRNQRGELLSWALREELLFLPRELPPEGRARDLLLREKFRNFQASLERTRQGIASELGVDPRSISHSELVGILELQASLQESLASSSKGALDPKYLASMRRVIAAAKQALLDRRRRQMAEGLDYGAVLDELKAAHRQLFGESFPPGWLARGGNALLESLSKGSELSPGELGLRAAELARLKVADFDALAEALAGTPRDTSSRDAALIAELKKAYQRSRVLTEARNQRDYWLRGRNDAMRKARQEIRRIQTEAARYLECTREYLAKQDQEEARIRASAQEFRSRAKAKIAELAGDAKRQAWWKEQLRDLEAMLAKNSFHSIWANIPRTGSIKDCNLACLDANRARALERVQELKKKLAEGSLSEAVCSNWNLYGESGRQLKDWRERFQAAQAARAKIVAQALAAELEVEVLLEVDPEFPELEIPPDLDRSRAK